MSIVLPITCKFLKNFCKKNGVVGVSHLKKIDIINKIFTHPNLRIDACYFLAELGGIKTYDFYISTIDIIVKDVIKRRCLLNFSYCEWHYIILNRTLTNNFIIEFQECFKHLLEPLIKNQKMTDHVLLQIFNEHAINYPFFTLQDLNNNDFIVEKYYTKILWPLMIFFQKMGPSLINYIFDKRVIFEDLNLQTYFGRLISKHQVLTTQTFRKLKNILCWKSISSYQNLTDEDIIEFATFLDWNKIIKKYTLSQYVVDKLPKPYQEINCTKIFNKITCGICLLENTVDMINLMCNHKFCKSCIDVWLNKHSSCPYCRISILYIPSIYNRQTDN